MGGGSWRGANKVSRQRAGPGCSNTFQGDWTKSKFSSQRTRGTKRRRAYSVQPLLVHWWVRFSATMRPAIMHGRTCGLNAPKAAVSHHRR